MATLTAAQTVDRAIHSTKSTDEDGWDALCTALESLSGKPLALALKQLSASPGFQAWRGRRAPEAWCRALAAGQHEPRMQAATEMNLTMLRPLKEPLLSTLMAAPELAAIRDVSFALCHIQPPSGKVIAAAPHLTALERLTFSLCRLGDAGLGHLAKSATIPPLTALALRSSGLKERSCKVVATSKWFARLQSLDLANNHLGLEGMTWLAKAPLPALQALDVGGSRITSAGFEALVASALLPSLTSLDASLNELEGASLAALIQGPLGSQLETLKLGSNPLHPAGAQQLATWTRSKLRSLDLYSTVEDAAGGRALIEALARAGILAKLEALTLSVNPLGPKGAQALAAGLGPTIKKLELASCALGDDGVAALAASPALAQLERLSLNDNQLTDVGAAALAKSKHLGRVKELEVRDNALTAKGIKLLKQAATLAPSYTSGLEG